MKSVCIRRVGLCLLLLGTLTGAQALTVDFKSVTLSAEQRASLKRFLADSSPTLSFDWNSLEAHSHSIERERHPLSVSLNTVPALTAAGLCRSEQHHFYIDAAAGRGNGKGAGKGNGKGAGKGNGTGTGTAKGKGRWHANDDLTSLQAWTPQGADCTVVSSPIDVGKSLSDAEFLFIEREKHALRSRAAQVIGGSDCARVRYCEVTLRRINRVREESPSRISRTLTKLTFTPLKPGPACLYVMEVSFVGPLNDLVPLGASCPLP